MSATTRTTLLTLTSATLVTLLAMPQPQSTLAQDALGSGNALDSNLSTQGTTNERSYQEDFRARNLVVTNQAPGGRGFRGSVGYTAENDFRGQLGSDDTYRFRSDSAFSAPAFLNYGQTYQQLRFGRELASLEYTRDFQGSTLSSVQMQYERPAPGDVIDARVQLERISRSSQGMSVYETAPSGDMVGVTYDREGNPLVARASSLYGINMTPAQGDVQQIGLTLYDLARIRQEQGDAQQTPVVGQPFQPSFQDALDPYQQDFEEEDERPEPDSKITPDRVGEREDLNVSGERIDLREGPEPVDLTQRQTSYRDVLRRVVERYAGNENVALNIDPALVEQFEAEYAELRQGLRGTYDRPVAPEMPVVEEEEPEDAPELTEPEPAITPPTQRDADEDEEEDAPSDGPIPDRSKLHEIDQLAAALRHGQRIDKLSPGDESRFNELVAQAEDALKKGEFFLAERRFDRALRFNPGNPLATAGMGHSQIGSGLYLSAALSLRNLLTNNPEMIDVRYSEALIPARGRLESAITTIRERLEEKQDVALNAFLLAYIGKLLDDRTLMREGLDRLARALPGDPLEQLLRAVWLSDAPRPAPANSPQK